MQTVRPRRKPAGRRFFPRRKVCQFCVDKVTIDYKDVQRLRRFVSEWGKIESRRKTGTCSPHQRQLSTAIKRARYLAWLPYTGGHSQIELGRPDRGGPRGPRPPFRDGPVRDYASPSMAPPASDAPSADATAPAAAVDAPTPEAAAPETLVAEAPDAEAPATEIEAAPAEAESVGGSDDAADDSDK